LLYNKIMKLNFKNPNKLRGRVIKILKESNDKITVKAECLDSTGVVINTFEEDLEKTNEIVIDYQWILYP
jgi:hypothetical protein